MNTKNALLASAVASLFLAGAARADHAKTSSKKSSTVKCAGANSCGGKGSCKSADNSCKGQNSCKGKGWTAAASEKECTDQGGKVMADAK
jgi:hypothetical protein